MKKSLPISNDFCPQTLFLYGTYKEDQTPNFGLFCWFSYYWDTEMGVMACIGGDKLTRQRIAATKVFSANLVTEELLPFADYLGTKEGFSGDKIVPLETEKGAVLPVPILAKSPWIFELEVDKSILLDDGEVFLCKIRNVLADEMLCDESMSIEERIRTIAPISTTCETYFSWDGKALGAWGVPGNSQHISL
ncbi:MAG: flavin reductase family protein [Lachnospiraceae bacterium]|jgi:flavin reductase (DIM6/NTAB) family NADH-FMN oxidoreductase RutF|nr:flavin reductase family protein [Lachnospiraceae bacterium]